MRIDSTSSRSALGIDSQTFAASTKDRTASTAAVDSTAIKTPDASSGNLALDFTSMTRKNLFDWMNASIKSGAMTVEESTPFLGLSLNLNQNGEQIDPATDTELLDFTLKARDAINAAISFKDRDTAARYTAALSTMLKLQGAAARIDLFA